MNALLQVKGRIIDVDVRVLMMLNAIGRDRRESTWVHPRLFLVFTQQLPVFPSDESHQADFRQTLLQMMVMIFANRKQRTLQHGLRDEEKSRFMCLETFMNLHEPGQRYVVVTKAGATGDGLTAAAAGRLLDRLNVDRYEPNAKKRKRNAPKSTAPPKSKAPKRKASDDSGTSARKTTPELPAPATGTATGKGLEAQLVAQAIVQKAVAAATSHKPAAGTYDAPKTHPGAVRPVDKRKARSPPPSTDNSFAAKRPRNGVSLRRNTNHWSPATAPSMIDTGESRKAEARRKAEAEQVVFATLAATAANIAGVAAAKRAAETAVTAVAMAAVAMEQEKATNADAAANAPGVGFFAMSPTGAPAPSPSVDFFDPSQFSNHLEDFELSSPSNRAPVPRPLEPPRTAPAAFWTAQPGLLHSDAHSSLANPDDLDDQVLPNYDVEGPRFFASDADDKGSHFLY